MQRPLPPEKIRTLVAAALQEDGARADITTRTLIDPRQKIVSRIVARQPLTLCGLEFAKQAFRLLDPRLRCKSACRDGEAVEAESVILEIRGLAQAILSAERVALNYLQYLSGIATFSTKFVQAVAGTGVKILDTRKTRPGLRELERYAVRCGGAFNHRFDLKSGVMVKDNHLTLISDFPEILKRLTRRAPRLTPVLEVKTFAQLQAALDAGARYLQLDNMTLAQLKKAVRLNAGSAQLEATGGVTLHNVRKIAETGVDFISIGALTHSATASDLSLDIL